MSIKKIQKSYTDNGFGFPVQIINAPMMKINGEWTLNLNYEKYEKAVLFALAMKPTCLTGNEVKFVRLHFEMDLKSFGKRFGGVAHSAVIKWEKFAAMPTNMGWATEKDIRLAIINKVNPKFFRAAYIKLEDTALRKSQKIKIDTTEQQVA